MNTIDPILFRNALGTFATGVTVVTTRSPDGCDVGVTANSFNSVSLDPPLVLWSLNRSSASLQAFTKSDGFAVHVLAADQQALSNRFASKMENRFADLEFERGYASAPLLADCAAQFQCRLAFRYDGGDHEILVGEVVALAHSSKSPLVYHGGRYGAVTGLAATACADSLGRGGDLMHLLSRVYHQLFADEREEFMRRGMTEEGYLVLRLLANTHHRDLPTLSEIAVTAGRTIDAATIDDLIVRGEVQREGDGTLVLTAAGRQTMVEFSAVRLAVEEDAMQPFDRSETDLLKTLLRRLAQQRKPVLGAGRSREQTGARRAS